MLYNKLLLFPIRQKWLQLKTYNLFQKLFTFTKTMTIEIMKLLFWLLKGIFAFQAFLIINGAFFSRKNRTTQIEQQAMIIPQI